MAARAVLILGGTREAVALAERLVAEPGLHVTTSLAGATRRPARTPGAVRVGGFGGASGLARYLDESGVHAVLDATHPFAAAISSHAVAACEAAERPLVRLLRPPWSQQPGDRWHHADELWEAACALPHLGCRVFLATGTRDLAPFSHLADTWFLLRAVERPATPIPLARHRLVLARGPFDEPGELALFREHDIDLLVTRNAGGGATGAKVRVARALGLPVVMVRRPRLAAAEEVATVSEAVAWVRRRLS